MLKPITLFFASPFLPIQPDYHSFAAVLAATRRFCLPLTHRDSCHFTCLPGRTRDIPALHTLLPLPPARATGQNMRIYCSACTDVLHRTLPLHRCRTGGLWTFADAATVLDVGRGAHNLYILPPAARTAARCLCWRAAHATYFAAFPRRTHTRTRYPPFRTTTTHATHPHTLHARATFHLPRRLHRTDGTILFSVAP